jgi:ABC-2 type transport system ATP-binding protein
MIEARGLTKRYGAKTAVDDLSFTIQPGVVTGFLGPNGAGKSTTMRMIIGLDRPTRGTVTVNGKHYRELTAPICEVGVLLEARAVHTGRSAYKHLLALAQTHGIPRSRVDEVIGMVGLTEVAGRRVGGFSLGMGQRLGIAAALLGDPDVLLLDEPVNGLDPEGIRWIRTLLQRLAAEGRTIFISSHLMSEVALTATHLIVVGRGRLIADTSVEDFVRSASGDLVHVRSPQAARLGEVLGADGATVTVTGADTLDVNGWTAERIGDAAFAAGVALHELTPRQVSLEDAFMDITRDAVEYEPTQAGAGAPVPGQAASGQQWAPAQAPVPAGAAAPVSNHAQQGGQA